MLYDLNLAWSPSTSQEKLVQSLILAFSFGYQTVALNHSLSSPAHANQTSPFPPTPSSAPGKIPHVLHRATISVSDPSTPNYRLQALMGVYDILAVRPVTKEAFHHACLTLDMPIISLDLTQHFPFHFRPKPCMAAVSRGVRFEICYGQALAADARGRANFIGNATGLIRATRGRGIIVSSEAKTALGLRAPADVVNLLNVWGLPNEKGLEGLGSAARSVVVNEGIKRNGFRGVIDVVQVAERPRKSDIGVDGVGGRGVGGEERGADSVVVSDASSSGKRKMEQDGSGRALNKKQKQTKKTKVATRVDGQERKR